MVTPKQENDMAKSLTKEEKMVLIAVMKYIISTDGVITEREIADINELAEKKGFEDFQKIFEEVDREVKSIDDLKDLIRKIEKNDNRDLLLRYALEFSRADANVNLHEIEILKFMSKTWGIKLDSMMGK